MELSKRVRDSIAPTGSNGQIYILVASNGTATLNAMIVCVVFCLEQFFCLRGGRIERQPPVASRMHYVTIFLCSSLTGDNSDSLDGNWEGNIIWNMSKM
jgi:hypothetical protein